jgi:hypothetical protein
MRALKLKSVGRTGPARPALPADIQATLDLMRSQAAAHVQKLDESEAGNWARLIAVVRQVGLTKDTLCRELSCAWSTILRWESGQTVPGPFARKAIKERLLELLAEKRKKSSAALSRVRTAR